LAVGRPLVALAVLPVVVLAAVVEVIWARVAEPAAR
jgi:hypothetical protein